jgi:hypothetical protein
MMSLRVGLRDHPVSWDEQTGVTVHKETLHTALILLIINSLVPMNIGISQIENIEIITCIIVYYIT